jgi:hypothetical protein
VISEPVSTESILEDSKAAVETLLRLNTKLELYIDQLEKLLEKASQGGENERQIDS